MAKKISTKIKQRCAELKLDIVYEETYKSDTNELHSRYMKKTPGPFLYSQDSTSSRGYFGLLQFNSNEGSDWLVLDKLLNWIEHHSTNANNYRTANFALDAYEASTKKEGVLLGLRLLASELKARIPKSCCKEYLAPVTGIMTDLGENIARGISPEFLAKFRRELAASLGTSKVALAATIKRQVVNNPFLECLEFTKEEKKAIEKELAGATAAE